MDKKYLMLMHGLNFCEQFWTKQGKVVRYHWYLFLEYSVQCKWCHVTSNFSKKICLAGCLFVCVYVCLFVTLFV